jgi:hypothetical protein
MTKQESLLITAVPDLFNHAGDVGLGRLFKCNFATLWFIVKLIKFRVVWQSS